MAPFYAEPSPEMRDDPVSRTACPANRLRSPYLEALLPLASFGTELKPRLVDAMPACTLLGTLLSAAHVPTAL